VTAAIEHLGFVSMTVEQRVLRGAELLVHASVNLACVAADELKPTRVPAQVRSALETQPRRIGHRTGGRVNVTQDLSLLSLISNASFVVKLVIGLMLAMSLTSWWFIFRKAFVVRDARRKAEDFERTFWSGSDLNSLFQAIVSSRRPSGSMERIFEAGFREFVKLRKQTTLAVASVMDGTAALCERPISARWNILEKHLAFLATVGSVSPYIGLLGTVWGIMNAFRGLANVHQATLAQVAPGIAEALMQPPSACSQPSRQWWRSTITRARSIRCPPLRELHGGILQHPPTQGGGTG
jgi:biopolymer transport protein TolQ